MRDTFFREQSENFELNESSEQMKFPELYGLQEETMKPVDIKDPEVTNCEHPYSYGDVNEISKGLDYIQGDIGMSAGGTCVLTTISNILRECGTRRERSCGMVQDSGIILLGYRGTGASAGWDTH